MNRVPVTATRPQLALQSYLDALLQEAAVELEQAELDEFQAAVLEEQVRDARLLASAAPLAEPVARIDLPVAPVTRFAAGACLSRLLSFARSTQLAHSFRL